MGAGLTATKILWGQILVVFAVVLATLWGATEWTAWRLGFQPQLGPPWFTIADVPIYLPVAFFWWWYHYDAYAPGKYCHEHPETNSKHRPHFPSTPFSAWQGGERACVPQHCVFDW